MGSIQFSLSQELATFLKEHLNIQVFLETGTFQGRTAEFAAQIFPRVYTIEGSEKLFNENLGRLSQYKNIKQYQGNSPDILRRIKDTYLNDNSIFWLDAHWCNAPNTAKIRTECPVLEELEAIETLNRGSVILIDDARLFFNGPPAPHNRDDWPDISEISIKLRGLSTSHRLSVYEDVIVYAPRDIARNLAEFTEKQKTEAGNRALSRRAISCEQTDKTDNIGVKHKISLNQSIESYSRACSIFTSLLAREDIRAFLDIGAHKGEFAKSARDFGFEGTIYSVEPMTECHRELANNAAQDPRWIILPRQAAGESNGRMLLNISQNSYSSSLLRVTSEHISAAPNSRVVRTEECVITPSRDLLDSLKEHQIQAVKIDTQGFEEQVLRGLGTELKEVKLVLVEMNALTCYEGCTDMLTLDHWLTEVCGFKRIALEPSFYNEQDFTCQQYDGIYLRKTGNSAERANTLLHGKNIVDQLITSIPPRGPEAKANYAFGHNKTDWEYLCRESWVMTSSQSCAVSESNLQLPGIKCKKVPARPTIVELLNEIDSNPNAAAATCLICNADIAYTSDFLQLLPSLDTSVVYFGNRCDVSERSNPTGLEIIGEYLLGYDYFILPSKYRDLITQQWKLLPLLRIGQPWWDYLFPIVTTTLGLPTKRLNSTAPLALHLRHEAKFSSNEWTEFGLWFIEAVTVLHNNPRNHARSLTERLVACFEDNAAKGTEKSLKATAQLVLDYF